MTCDIETDAGGYYGRRISQHLGMDGSCLLEVKRKGSLALAVTRLTSERLNGDRSSPIPAESAFSIIHQLGDLDWHSSWLAGRARFAGAFAAGTASVTDLRDHPQCEFRGVMDALQYYVPRQAIDEFAHENGAKPIATMSWNRDRHDPLLSNLSRLFLHAIAEDRSTNQLFIDQLALSTLAHFAQTYGGLRVQEGAAQGGLAPWQERRAREIMRVRFASHLSIADVAAECRLTPSHFARAFRRSVGMAPHEYLSSLRIEEAKRLMLATKLPLADIALICGFGDQSYFTRVFSRCVGASPGAWRRTRLDA